MRREAQPKPPNLDQWPRFRSMLDRANDFGGWEVSSGKSRLMLLRTENCREKFAKMNRAENRRRRKIAEKASKNVRPVQPARSSPERQQKLTIQQALDLAVQHHTAGRLPQAKSIYQQILQTDDSQPVALHLLGVIAHQVGKNDIAVDLITKALVIKPEYAEAHTNLGNALQDLGKLDEAVDSYQKALAIKPNFAEAHNNLGNALQDLGKLDEAVDSYHKALAIKPEYAEAHNNLGTALQELWRPDAAVASYHKALAIKPDYAEAHRHLAGVSKFSEYDDDIKAMEYTYALPGLIDEQRMHLAFGLGKAFEDLCQYEKAFGFFLTGNAIKHGTCEFSIESVEKSFENLKKLFTRNLFSKHRGVGSSDETPIFVLGMPRAGTTLVEQILASHPKVHGAGELGYLNQIVTSYFGKIGDDTFSENFNQASIRDISIAGDEYIGMVRERADTAAYITNKMPDNFMFIGMIKLMLPNAKIIHCRRDPLDTCLSIFKNLFTANNYYYAYDLSILGQYYLLYRDLMTHWCIVLPDFIYNIQYEDVVAEQEKQSRALLAYCGLEWDNACLEFYRTDRPVTTLSSAQVRRPIYKDSVRSWKRYENQLAPLLEVL